MTDQERIKNKILSNKFSAALSVTTNVLRMLETGRAVRELISLNDPEQTKKILESTDTEEEYANSCVTLADNENIVLTYAEDDQHVTMCGILACVWQHKELMKKRRKK